jgi:hypothetical protein
VRRRSMSSSARALTALVRVAQMGDAVRVEAGQHADRDVEGDRVPAGGQEARSTVDSSTPAMCTIRVV